ncbi:MAG TPA: GIY-YIG nuclease family protein [Pirellulaceae bacterium]|nr:GIY-YIG nuclease family protein [Planctomycetales bacterium]HRX79009.1 GIY-YIG nuclease family protein [Pirellulaceae bacterium]
MTPSLLVEAFDAVRDGYPADRVVADPMLNEPFISECRRRGLHHAPAVLNHSLLNLRKRGGLTGKPRSKRTHFTNEDDYRFASEMAARFLERREGISLDNVLCDPDLAKEFDRLAADIAPGFSPLQYRWAALNLRKARRLEPEVAARIAPPVAVQKFRAVALDLADVPVDQGLYLFFASKQLLYVGESENLRSRLKKHLDHSDNKGLARWLWEFGADELHIEVQVLAANTDTRVRKALELELIRSREPIFNVKR